MQDQLQFAICYTWVNILSRDINLQLFVKMYCKTFINKNGETKGNPLEQQLKSRNMRRTKKRQFKQSYWVQQWGVKQLIPQDTSESTRLFLCIDMYSCTLCLNIHCPCSPMAFLRPYSKTASTVMSNTYNCATIMPVTISTFHHSAKIFTDI